MAIEQIDSFLTDGAIANFELIKGAASDLRAVGAAIVDVNGKIQASEQKRAKTTTELKDNLRGLDEETKNLLKLGLEYQYQISETAKREAVLRNQIAEARKANKEYAESIKETTDAYKKLEIEHRKLEIQAKQIGALYGAQSKQFKDAASAANEYGKKLKDIDAGLGNYRRNVGNYASGYSLLGNAIQQVGRELPNFAQSFEIGVRSLSNQIGQLQDGVAQVIATNKELIAQGLPTTSVFKTIVKQIFSLQTALLVGVTLLIAYSKEIGEWGKALIKGRDSIDKLIASTETLNKAIQSTEYKDAVKDIQELTTNIDLARQGFLKKEDVLKQYNETLGKSLGQVSSLDEAEKAMIERGSAYIQITLAKAAAQLALEDAAKKAYEAELERRKKLEEFSSLTDFGRTSQSSSSGGFGGGVLGLPSTTVDEKAVTQDREKRKKKAVDLLEKEKNTFQDIAKQFQKDAASLAKENSIAFFPTETNVKDHKKNINDYTKDIENFQQTLKELAKKFREGSADDFNFQDANSTIQFLQDFIQTRLQSQTNAALSENERLLLEKVQEIDTELNSQLVKIYDKQIRGGYKSQEEYQKAITDVTKKYAIERLQIQVQSIEADLSLLEPASKEYKKYYDNLIKLQKELAGLQAGQSGSGEPKWVENLKKWLGRWAEVISMAESLALEAANAVDAMYQARLDKLDKESETLKENSEKEIESINRQALTAEERERRIQIARAKTDAQEQQIEARRKQVLLQQAKFNRAVTIGEIIANTAKAVVVALTEGDPYTKGIRAALAGALGAAQIARVAATPLPSYAEGTLDHVGGKARVGEAGPELVITPDGKLRKVTQETILDLPKHSKVFNEDQLNSMGISWPKFNDLKSDYNFERLEDVFEKGINKLDRTLRRKNWNPNISFYGNDDWKRKHTRGK